MSIDNDSSGFDTENSVEVNADEVIKELRDQLMHYSIDTDSEDEDLKAIALATELDSRLAERDEEMPAEYDARQHIQGDRTVEAVDSLIAGAADDLSEQANEGDNEEVVMEVVAELNTRIGCDA